MQKQKVYVGVNNDLNGGLTNMGRGVLNAWVFNILPETETCEGWTFARIHLLMQEVDTEWEKYGLMVSNLPPELAERHDRIYSKFIKKASDVGWSGEVETRGEN